ncbi:MAG: 30S ribosomal protein S6 [Acidimicrobiia bacterium]|nr:30S ribosomal protein S6 [Acidimicrobiia bacterium]
MRNYEVMTIHRPEIAEADVRLKVAEIEALLKARGAEVTDSDFWGKRRFAYEINHIREGFYSVVQFDLEASPEALEDLDRALTLSDAVVRHKVVRRDNR